MKNFKNNSNSPGNPFIGTSPSSLRDVLSVFFRHKKKIVLFFVLVVAAFTLFTYTTSPVYQSEAKVLIRVGRENATVDPAVMGPTINLTQSREQEVNSEISILKNRLLAEQVVDTIGAERILNNHSAESPNKRTTAGFFAWIERLGLTYTLSPRERAIVSVMNNMDAMVEKYTLVIKINYNSKNPELSKEILDHFVKYYLEHHIKVFQTQASPQFFQEQSNKLMAELTDKEQLLEKFKSEFRIASMEDQKKQLITQIGNLQMLIDNVGGQVSASEVRIATLKKSLESGRIPKNEELSRAIGGPQSAAENMKTNLITLKLKASELSSRYLDDYRPLVEVRDQIKLVQDFLNNEAKSGATTITSGVDSNYKALVLTMEREQAELQAFTAQKKSLTEELAKRRAELDQLTSNEVRLTNLQREVSLLTKEYSDYRDNQRRALIYNALDTDKVTNVVVLQPATLPIDPIRPRKIRDIALGIVLGLFGSMVLAFFMEFLDQTVKSGVDVEKRLGLPLLTTITEKEFKSCT